MFDIGDCAPPQPTMIRSGKQDLVCTLEIFELYIVVDLCGNTVGITLNQRPMYMVWPVPGEPTSNTLWPPAAAISSARLACAWPRTSARSRSSAAAARTERASGTAAAAQVPFSRPTASESVGAASTWRPSTASASAALSTGTTSVSMRWRRHASPTASVPRTGWIWPSSASSPTTAYGPMTPFFTTPVGAGLPTAIGRSDGPAPLPDPGGGQVS